MAKIYKHEEELKPIYDRQKSFYGKAYYRYESGYWILRSYNTDVVAIRIQDQKVIRLWWDYSVTTMRHINEFLAQFGINEGGKRYWESLPVEKIA